MDSYKLLATFGGALLIIGGLPQIFRLYKLKKAHGVSISMFSLVFVGQLSWIIYGLHLKDSSIIIFTNLFTAAVSFTIIFLILKYRDAEN